MSQPPLSGQDGLSEVQVEVSEAPGQQDSCMLLCNKNLTAEVRRQLTDDSCCDHFKSNFGWWCLACTINSIGCPFVMLYHSVILYLVACFSVYCETLCCKVCSTICCDCWRFTDQDFPPNHDSLGDCERGYKRGAPPPPPACCSPTEFREVGSEVEWRRVIDLNWGNDLAKNKIGHPLMIADGVEPSDIKQGSLGNCWLLAALACLADHKGKITRALVSKVYNPRGRYTFRLADIQAGPGKFMEVTVDDFIPTMNDGDPCMALNCSLTAVVHRSSVHGPPVRSRGVGDAA